MFDTLYQLHKINFFKMQPNDSSVAGHSKWFVLSIFPWLYDANYFFFLLNYHILHFVSENIIFSDPPTFSNATDVTNSFLFLEKSYCYLFTPNWHQNRMITYVKLSKILIKHLPGNAWPCWRNCGGNFFDSSPRRIWTPSLWNSELGSELGSFTDFVFSLLLFLAPSL